MRYVLSLTLMILTATATAQGQSPTPPPPAPPPTVTQAQTQGQEQNVSQSLSGAQEQSQSSESSSESSSDSSTDNAGNSSNDIDYRDVRQAPPVYIPALNNTAVGLKCFGLGISHAEDGSATGGGLGHCWLQRDAFALQRYYQFVEENKPEQAATVFCRKPLLRGAYHKDGMSKKEVVTTCHADRVAVITQYWDAKNDVPDPLPPVPGGCTPDNTTNANANDEALRRCEARLTGVK